MASQSNAHRQSLEISVSASVLEPHAAPPPFTLGSLVVAYGLLLLFVRAVFSDGLAINQMGLAIGGCGWLLTGLAQQSRSAFPDPIAPQQTIAHLWDQIGGTLLILGWLATIYTQPSQALAVSGLILGQFHRQFTYISVFLADWAVWQWLDRQAIEKPWMMPSSRPYP
ncbi:hypothetical protein [Trichothermofontia sp.]